MHLSLVVEPNSQYIRHVTSSSGTAKDECKTIYDYTISDLDGGPDELEVVGFD